MQDASDRMEELVEIVSAYNQVTDKLQKSHEALTHEVRRLQDELASANAALMRSKRLAALGEMAAGIAHEIRNPLASIRLYAGMLNADLVHMPEQQGVAGNIIDAVRGLDSIVEDVLAFAREIQVALVEGSAEDLFHSVLETTKAEIESAGVQIVVADGSDDAMFSFDRDLMHRAVANLVRNGIEAMESGGTLTLAAEVTNERVTITVRDTGSGIDDETIERIFNPFFTTRASGTGLGLAIVNRIVEAHDGTIDVANDNGAVFTITLPGVATEEEAEPVSNDVPDQEEAVESHGVTSRWDQYRLDESVIALTAAPRTLLDPRRPRKVG